MGSHCFECIRAARPPAKERLRRWNATAGPLVSKALIAVNLGVFALMAANSLSAQPDDDLEAHLVIYGDALRNGEWWRLITSGFVQFSLLHLAFNMVLLYRLGELLEPRLRRTRFTLLYFAGLVSGSMGAVLVSPDAATGGRVRRSVRPALARGRPRHGVTAECNSATHRSVGSSFSTF